MSECPVSFIEPESIELAQLCHNLMRANKAGMALAAADLPGNILDAMSLCYNESGRADSAMEDSVFTS